MSKLTCFKAYDIRGKLGDELNEDIAYRIGRAYGSFLGGGRKVAVGADVRLTSESLKIALSDGLMDAGIDVLDLGMTGTEEIYFASFHLNLDGGIEVTASHNPLDYNGMKLVREGARPISGDTGLREIQELTERNEFLPPDHRGKLERSSCLDDYIAYLLDFIDLEKIRPLKIVVNAGNGAAGHVIDGIERVFISRNLPVTFIKIHHEPDGTFPNGIPNPLLPECREDTSQAVIEHGADIGIAWDGDFDRCFLFDEGGRFIEGYYIVGMLAEAFLKKETGAKIIHDPRLTWNTIEIVRKNGGIPIQSKTGHAFIKERMRTEDAVYGGEMSAHHYFRDFAYCDSGMIPWLLVIELLSKKNQPLSNMVAERINAFPSPGEINFNLQYPLKAIKHVKSHYEGEALVIDETDGISMEFSDWRLNLRASNTEPVIRLNLETRADSHLMRMKVSEISEMLELYKNM
jgi:phosphomannomutase